MKRLTTDTPNNNFETAMNFVRGGGWATIRAVGEEENVPLTDWAKAQCIVHGCDEFPGQSAEEIDETICDCIMDGAECPVAMAYAFATQAVHLRDRLKAIEDVLGDDYDLMRIYDLVQAEKDGRLAVLPCKANTVYTIERDYFNCNECDNRAKAYFQSSINKVACNREEGDHCPYYIRAHQAEGFEIHFDANGGLSLSNPGDFGYEGLEEFFGIDEKVYYSREEAEAALEAIKKTEDLTPPSEPQL